MRRRVILRSAVFGGAVLLAAGLAPVLAVNSVAVAATTPACTTSAPVTALPIVTGTLNFLKPTVSLTLVARVPTDQPSPGLDAALRIPGDHGFTAVFRTGLGTRTFCVEALNVGPGSAASTPLGCRTVVEHFGPDGLPG